VRNESTFDSRAVAAAGIASRAVFRRAAGCIAALAVTAAGAQQGTPPGGDVRNSAVIDPDTVVVPVHHEPHHRQVFQYGTTRILDLQVPPGETSWFHTHEWPVLYVTLGRSAVRTQNLGEDWGGGGGAARTGVLATGVTGTGVTRRPGHG
jgi:hypothetical protein